MIDTIKIRLPLKPLNPANPLDRYYNDDDFEPMPLSHIWKYNKQPYVKTMLNPGKALAKGTRYTPTYTGEKMVNYDGLGVGHFLSIEVSLPKLLYGNNVEEFLDGRITLDIIAKELQWAIKRDLKLKYSEKEILSGKVTKIHVGKNVLFSDPGAPTTIVRTICKSAENGRYDNSEVRFENKGYAFKLHINKKEVIGYDKKTDLEQSLKSLKRSIDNGITERIKLDGSPISDLLADRFTGVFRFEVRLNDTRHIKKAFPEIGDELTFQNVFLNAHIMPYLAQEWQDLTKDVSMIELGRNDVLALFEAIAADNISNGYSLRDSLATAAAAYIINESSLNHLRRIVEKHYDRRSWYRLRKKLIAPESDRSLFFKKIMYELQKYKPIKL